MSAVQRHKVDSQNDILHVSSDCLRRTSFLIMEPFVRCSLVPQIRCQSVLAEPHS